MNCTQTRAFSIFTRIVIAIIVGIFAVVVIVMDFATLVSILILDVLRAATALERVRLEFVRFSGPKLLVCHDK